MIDGVWVGASTIRSHVVSLACLTKVSVKDNFSVNGNLDIVSLDDDFFAAPLTYRFVLEPLGRDDTVG